MFKEQKISKHYFVLLIVLTLVVTNFFLFRNENIFWTINFSITVPLLIILYIGVTRHRLNYFYTSINSGKKKGISLTFDDGPNEEFTEKVLSILKEKEVKATFFIIGKNIQKNETLLKKIDEQGHLIGNHSFNHTYWINSLPSKMIAKEIHKNETAIQRVIGKKPFYYRTPFGLTSPNVARAIKSAKVKSIGWDFRSFDTMAKNKALLLKKLKDNANKCSIMLLHDGNKYTVAVLRDFLDYCKSNGIEIVPLDEMIGIKAYK